MARVPRPSFVLLSAAVLAFLPAASPLKGARAAGPAPVLHEPIAPDPHEDLALSVQLDGDLPAAIQTKTGPVPAPDPRRPASPDEGAYDADDDATFTPDRNTKRPDVRGYEDPFTPSTAPFKRLEAFDAVSERLDLFVRDARLEPLPIGARPANDGIDEQFYADLVIDAAPGRRVRIPSVGPGARVLRARLGIGADDVPFELFRDGADNWFVESTGAAGRARLVMQLAIPRAVFAGDVGDPSWHDLPRVAPLPERVARSARRVREVIGVDKSMRPREAVAKLVAYFRGFVDSDEPPQGEGDIYLDLALSKKGVCRHRAFAFTITALSMGIPTRLALNEAHAWVEVWGGGGLWHRVDLGGAGRMVNPGRDLLPERPVYEPPPDPFAWPQGAERGSDMVEQAREQARRAGNRGREGTNGPDGGASSGEDEGERAGSPAADERPDARPASVVSLLVAGGEAHRGAPLAVRGDVRADGEPCTNVLVEILLRDPKTGRASPLGTLATRQDGTYAGAIVVPGTVLLGEYDVTARTPGDARCGRGGAP